VVVALSLGLGVGLVAGCRRGGQEEVARRLCGVQLSLPCLLFVAAVASVLDPSLANVVLGFGVASFPLFARLARGEALRFEPMEA
jgi:peptide/nickel transport system permease protein